MVLGDRAVVSGPLGAVGTGVEALGIEHIRDRFLDAVVTHEQSQTAFLEAKQNALSRAEVDLGPGSAVDLRDQRQAKIEELTQFLNISTTAIPNGDG